MAQKTGRIVAVCHVLRYAPYFVKMKELVSKGAIGEIVSVQHLEPIEHLHMAHAYVRGNWHNSKTSTPIIMAKSCHDLDIVRWIVDKPSKHIAAMGDLKWFRKENAPAGSTARCIDGCTVEKECPYSALKHYYRKRIRIRHLDVPTEGITKEEQGNIILEKLKQPIMVDAFIKWIMTSRIIMLQASNSTIALPLVFLWKHLPLMEVEEPVLWAQWEI